MSELFRAIRSEDEVEIWKQLARADVKGFVNSQSRGKRETPLFCASMKGNINVVKNLLEKGAKVEMKTIWGATPLHAASERGHLAVVKLLVAKGSPLNQQTQFGDTPGHLAAYRGHSAIVECLVEAGSDIFIKNSERRTILDEASVAENAKTVRYLEGVIFGSDLRPTVWKTPYSKDDDDDPMVTTNLMQTGGNSNKYQTSSQRKPPIGRSRSAPEADQTKKRENLLDNLRYRMNNLSFDEVINHPTVQLRASCHSDDGSGLAKLNFASWGSSASSRSENDVMNKYNFFDSSTPPSRPHSDIASNSHRRKSPFTHACIDSETVRRRSLEKLVTELQCGLSYTQEELEKTKANLMAAKEKIDIVCTTQQNMNSQLNRDESNNERRRLILGTSDK